MKEESNPSSQLFEGIAALIQSTRHKIAVAVNLTMVHTYFEIGRMIVEDEQQGKEKAAYGKHTLQKLSDRLTEQFGKGFSADNLQNMRLFYTSYSIYETVSRKFSLSWSHYLVLMRVENPSERSFYEIESAATFATKIGGVAG